MKVKAKDKVLVISGKYKGKVGNIMRVYKKTGRITVEKINIRTKHIKKTTTRAGQIIKYEAPFDISNVMVICPNCNKATRVSYTIAQKKVSSGKLTKDIKKYRVCKKCGESLEQVVSKAENKKK
jgi:large subunit ribosomal protein L24